MAYLPAPRAVPMFVPGLSCLAQTILAIALVAVVLVALRPGPLTQ